ncbi:peroxisomal targeting signal 2 receptor [Tulasnella sp. JGI-2019a]|nr:peroxisomal targeting signal 2 receptor [Tulasnella sp. JGI-2019a]KAG9024633.1 peroxisomal targeting signal 2 receptor [Tulasnella sp. JGI-2019a]
MQGPPPPLILKTPPFAHYGLAWSPFFPNRIALASAANYGLVGNGRLHLASVGGGQIAIDKQYDTQDGLYDVAWSEVNENQIATASGDGSIKLWDVNINDLPIRAWHEHTREVFSVDWSNIEKATFVSASWDGSAKLWTPDRPHSVLTIAAHQGCVYQALFSPHTPSVIATCSLDGTVKLFDLRRPQQLTGGQPPLATPALTVPSSGGEALSIDWNKYRPWLIASSGVDRSIRVWDCRMVKPAEGEALTMNAVGGTCENELRGHEYAVRKIQWSPHRADLIASASYDMSCRVWTTAQPPPGRPSLLSIHDLHTEFAVGCAWSLYDEGLLASCSWDHSIHVYRPVL